MGSDGQPRRAGFAGGDVRSGPAPGNVVPGGYRDRGVRHAPPSDAPAGHAPGGGGNPAEITGGGDARGLEPASGRPEAGSLGPPGRPEPPLGGGSPERGVLSQGGRGGGRGGRRAHGRAALPTVRARPAPGVADRLVRVGGASFAPRGGAARTLAQEIASGAPVDEHAADQLDPLACGLRGKSARKPPFGGRTDQPLDRRAIHRSALFRRRHGNPLRRTLSSAFSAMMLRSRPTLSRSRGSSRAACDLPKRRHGGLV